MGYWNEIVGKEVGKYGLWIQIERGDRLVIVCRNHDLVITNTLFKNHKRRRYTYKMLRYINRYQLNTISL